MSNLHVLRISSNSEINLDAVGIGFHRESLLHARVKTWNAFHLIKCSLHEGLTEREARNLSLEIFKDLGVHKHWHRPYIRFGPGTALSFHNPLQETYRLKIGDPVYIDLGPVWPSDSDEVNYEGDVGDTFVFGDAPNPEAEKCARLARALFDEAQALWASEKLTGADLYKFLKDRCHKLGYPLTENVDGHRIGDFPHHKYSRERLANIHSVPAADLWVLEVQITHPTLPMGAFFEDVLCSAGPAGIRCSKLEI